MWTSCSPGFYGKVPILGDFVTRRLPVDFVRPWDTWLQGAMSVSQGELGTSWLDVYLTCPVWRFACSSGVCGMTAWTGVLMPSVDRIGRYFPFTLATELPATLPLPNLLVQAADWFKQMEQLALSVLDHEFDLEIFDRRVQAQILSVSPEHTVPTPIPDDTQGVPTGFHRTMAHPGELSEVLAQLHPCMQAASMPAHSLWYTTGSDHIRPSLRVYHGLPAVDSFVALLAGQRADLEDDWLTSLLDFEPSEPSSCTALDAQPSRLHWTSSGLTTVGHVRQINEDAFLDRPEIGLWAVADGVGGHHAGDEASQATVAALDQLSGREHLDRLQLDVETALQRVNSDLIAKARIQAPGQVIGSTVVVLLSHDHCLTAIWAGDSRLYCYREGVLSQLTQDHSLAVELTHSNDTSPSRPPPEVNRNIITRALGAAASLTLDVITHEPHAGDLYLLCSDGLTNEVKDEEIAAVLSQGCCEDSARELIELTLERGARDNVTVIVVRAD
jgi:type VI secretion system protein ImpM